MNQSIFKIADDLQNLFNQIEEFEGEITPELEEQLAITEENLENKIKAYHGKIQTLKGENKIIEDEKQRLSNLKSVKLNLIEKLKENVKIATLQFGYDGKSGNKKLDFDTLKTYTVNKDNIELEEDFNNPEFMYINVKLPGNFETVENLLKLIKEKVPNSENFLERFEELNSKLQVDIDRKKLKDVFKKGKKVDKVKLVNNPHVVMR